MAQLISELWEGLRAAGLPEVMLYLPDQSASRCHWDDTTMIGDVRVALLADQDRQIVRIFPVNACSGIGIASPKGTDPSGYKAVVQNKLRKHFGGFCSDEEVLAEAGASSSPPSPAATTPAIPHPTPHRDAAPPAPAEAQAAQADTLMSRWGATPRTSSGRMGGMAHLAR